MELIPIEKIPAAPKKKLQKIPAAPKKKLQKFIDDFVKSEVPRVEIIYAPGEYRNSHSCYSSFYTAVKLSGYKLRVVGVGERTFMENLALCHEK